MNLLKRYDRTHGNAFVKHLISKIESSSYADLCKLIGYKFDHKKLRDSSKVKTSLLDNLSGMMAMTNFHKISYTTEIFSDGEKFFKLIVPRTLNEQQKIIHENYISKEH